MRTASDLHILRPARRLLVAAYSSVARRLRAPHRASCARVLRGGHARTPIAHAFLGGRVRTALGSARAPVLIHRMRACAPVRIPRHRMPPAHARAFRTCRPRPRSRTSRAACALDASATGTVVDAAVFRHVALSSRFYRLET